MTPEQQRMRRNRKPRTTEQIAATRAELRALQAWHRPATKSPALGWAVGSVVVFLMLACVLAPIVGAVQRAVTHALELLP